jgi:hypothetical protein
MLVYITLWLLGIIYLLRNNYLLNQMMLLVIKNNFSGDQMLGNYHIQFYYTLIKESLFVESNDTISSKKVPCPGTGRHGTITCHFTVHGFGRNFLHNQMTLLVIKNIRPKNRHLSIYHSQFYCIWVRTEFFTETNDTISNKKYFIPRPDASLNIIFNSMRMGPDGIIYRPKWYY